MLINVILRLLPWWLREPIVMAICLALGGSCLYRTITDGGWAVFGFAVFFLAVAVLRAFVLRGELRKWQAGRGGGAKSAGAPAGSPASPAADGG
ncbi:hypothetical protein [Streptomyces graminilatus]|uniref:hypothetical protein n=1 Tax=Streptomyces graminilatus TaxID=1464070 RepID=UPI0006E42C1E|nr:hypothetical protein [Streptomyces graminilatus]